MAFSITLIVFLVVWVYAAFDTVLRRGIPMREKLLTGLFLVVLPPIGVVVWAVLIGHGLLRLAVLVVFALTLLSFASHLILPGLVILLLAMVVASGFHRANGGGRSRARIAR